MRHLPEKAHLKDYDFVDYKSGRPANRRARARMRRAAKRVGRRQWREAVRRYYD